MVYTCHRGSVHCTGPLVFSVGSFCAYIGSMGISDQIQAWIDADGAYITGVSLYRQVGGVKPVNYYHRYCTAAYLPAGIKDQLVRELQRYLRNHPPTTAITATPSRQKAKQSKKEPDAIVALRQQAIPLHKRYSHLKAELYAASTASKPDESKLYELADEIMRKTIPSLDHIYDQIREWQRTGEVPDMPRPLLVEQTVQKMRSVQSMRSRISNLRRRVKREKLSEQELQEIKLEIAEKEEQIAQISQELGLGL